MATVDELIVQIKADVKDLKKKMKDVNRELDKVGKKGSTAMSSTNREGKSLGATMMGLKTSTLAVAGALIGIGKVGGVIASVGAEFEDLKDSLDTVFGSVEAGDVAMDKVFEFAQTTPFQIETATKAFIALKSAGIEPSMDMLQTFADTASVSTDQLGTFEALIRTVQRSASGGMGLEELNQIADRGIDVLGIFKKELNLGKDDIAKFGKTAQGAELMVKALTKGLQEKFGGAMEVKMDNLSVKASNMTIAFKQLADDVFQSGMGDFLKELAEDFTALANSITRVRKISRGDIRAEGDERTLLELQEEYREGMLKEVSLLQQLESSYFGFADIQHGLEDQQRRNAQLLNIITIELEKNIAAQKESNVVVSKATVLTQDQAKFFNGFQKLLAKTVTPLEEVNFQIAMLNQLMREGVVDSEGNPLIDPEEGQAVLTHLQKVKKGLLENEEGMEMLQDAVISSSHAFTKDFVDSLLDGENALESFKNFSKDIVSQIITIFLQLEVVNRILAHIFPNFTGPVGTGLFSRTPVDNPATGLSSVGGASAARLGFGRPNAGGGRIQSGIATLVGEQGPEIFVPNTGGMIMNNMNTKNALGGGGDIIINQNLNFSTGVQSTVRSEVLKLLPTISEVTKASVMDSATRGGNFAKAIRG
tara:strand:- start:473 stop:2419 length:1947 start_codon:yes stop_codon:yes gene_type:complete